MKGKRKTLKGLPGKPIENIKTKASALEAKYDFYTNAGEVSKTIQKLFKKKNKQTST